MRRLLAPRWVVAHVIVLLVVPAFVALGLWQLSRHEQRAERNAAVEAGLEKPEVPIEQLWPLAPEDAYRRVELRGRWVDGDVLLGPRSRQGQPGYHVLTSFVVDGLGTVLVDRGWVAYDSRLPLPDTARVEGEAAIIGVVLPDERGARFVTIPPQGRPEIVSSIQANPIGTRLGTDLQPGAVLLESPTGSTPVPATLPELDAGPHLSYAVQWFLFAAVVAIGYPFALRRVLRSHEMSYGVRGRRV